MPARLSAAVFLMMAVVIMPASPAGAGSAFTTEDADKIREAAYPTGKSNGILFTFDGPGADGVTIAGDFNGWDQSATEMQRNKHGIWWAVVPTGSGSIQYKFVIDGNWETDPNNPDITGEFGNSVITVGPDGGIAALPAGKAVPLNPNVTFHGDFRSRLHSTLHTDEPVRIEDATQRVLLDLDCNLENQVMLWGRLNLQTEDADGRAKLERMAFDMSNPDVSLTAFYNVFGEREVELGDPYGLTSGIGSFNDSYGRNSQGLFLNNLRIGRSAHGAVLYGNDLDSGEDMTAARISAEPGIFSTGLSWRRKSGFDAGISPEGSGGGEYGVSDLAGIDFRAPLFGRALVTVEALAGRTVVRDVDEKTWNLSDRFLLYGSWQQILGGGLRLIARTTCELFEYTATAVSGYGLGETTSSGLLVSGLSLDRLGNEGAFFDWRIDLEYLQFFCDESLPWERLWDFERMDILAVPGFITTGYEKTLEIKTTAELLFETGWCSIGFNTLGIFNFAPVPGGPWVFDQSTGFEIHRGRLGLLGNVRTATYNSGYLGLDDTFFCGYYAVELSLGRNASIRLGYGLRPENDDDELRAREAFIYSNGLSPETVRTSYNSLGRAVTSAEETLSEYDGIVLEGRFTF